MKYDLKTFKYIPKEKEKLKLLSNTLPCKDRSLKY